MLKEYHKIETLFERDTQTKKLIDCDRFNNNKYSDEMMASVKKENYRLVDIRKEIFNNED